MTRASTRSPLHAASPPPPTPPPSSPAPAASPLALPVPHQRDLERALERWSTRFGSASLAELRTRAGEALAAALATPEECPRHGLDIDRLCAQLARAHEARFGRAALNAELTDERERDRASASGAALVHYHDRWQRRLARLSRAHPERWRVPGLSDDEVRDALTLRLIELIRAMPENEPPPGRAGKQWGLCMAEAHRSELRRSFRLAATPTDFGAAPLLQRAPSQEERWLELEADQRRTRAEQRARLQLNQPQRRWLAAMQLAAADGEFFASSDELNLSAASRRLGKDRSSAQRAYRALQARFQHELEHLPPSADADEASRPSGDRVASAPCSSDAHSR